MLFGNLFAIALKLTSQLIITCDYAWHDMRLAGKELEF